MDFGAIRLTIRRKLETGRLPLEKAPRVLGHSPSGRPCDGCDLTIGTGQLQLAVDGLSRQPGSGALQLHLRCFEIWIQERSSLLSDRARRPVTA
jgi:hypothetical protein